MKKLKFIVIGLGLVLVGCGRNAIEQQNKEVVKTENKDNILDPSGGFKTEKKDNLIDLGGGFKTDKKEIYFCQKLYKIRLKKSVSYCRIIKGADVGSFKIVDDKISKDKNSIYLYKIKINGIKDVETFKYLNDELVKDKNHVYGLTWDYSYSNIIESINDPESFEILSYSYAKDKNNVYNLYTNFSRIQSEESLSADVIEEADPSTFRIIKDEFIAHGRYVYSRDKNNCYDYDEIVPMSECEKIEKENQ